LLVEPSNPQDAFAQKRMSDMHELIELVTDWFSDVQRLDEQTLRQLMKLGAKAQKFLEFKEKLGLGGRKAVVPLPDAQLPAEF
jgi:DNA-binding transcriptional regulator GbsR (MarR family)